MYEELFFRNQGVLSSTEQRKLRDSRMAIIGLGGTGGFALENLLRIGVEDFIVFDGDRFELSNMNRQLLCSIPVLDRPKAEVARERARHINPSAQVEAYAHFTADSLEKLHSADVILDCTDRVVTHLAINEACRTHRRPHIFSACNYSQGMVTVLENYDLRRMFQLPTEKKKLDRYHQCTSILAPAATLAGGLAAAQAMAYLLKKPYVKAPEVLLLDVFGKNIFSKTRLE